ncbi:hypothetical protein F2Q69_00033964 [Brassica cretica]|uniref:Uncharacterized protein n=1 Tax=Brassica cretica TaxID=69181 RepID=A0A8S9SF13_BRACR|nr:hypothetical protein F2Q69_00033964 [Brassica cretica]
MGTGSGSDPESSSSGWSRAPGLVVKTLVLIGGAVLLKRLTKSTTRWDHSHVVSRSLSGEKFSKEQASRDPDNYFNISLFHTLKKTFIWYILGALKLREVADKEAIERDEAQYTVVDVDTASS